MSFEVKLLLSYFNGTTFVNRGDILMSDKYVREIEEILEGVESNSDPKAKLSKRRSAPMESQGLIPNGFSVRIREFIKITPKRLILLGIVVLVVAMILNLVISQWISSLVWFGLVLFVVAYGLLFIKRDGIGKTRPTGRNKSNRR
ncbi:uncharacterized protein METZ01_LOCUS435806 [marine metagenome]|uniref:Uncharacterized protein n=1 Tax=marine metagenome TaxID=408172 RepID=A0A382YI38_9ZZZZ|tara:strand:- start:12 stop:446 length:435 start_codon:yes stop_codon:yes gene_type:complete